MSTTRKKLKYGLGILFLALISLFILIFLFISPLAKYLIQKYDQQLTGREITLNHIYVNPFTGFLYVTDLKIKEFHSDTLFLNSESVSLNFDMLKLFSKTYEISEISLNQPKIRLIQHNKVLNLQDLIDKFLPKNKVKKKSPVHFNLLNIKINDGVLVYQENKIPIDYHVIHLNISSPGLRWDKDSLNADISLVSGIGSGSVKGKLDMNLKNLDYKLDAVIHQLQLKFLEQYFKQISNYGSFRASLNANLKTKGNFKDAQHITAKGLIIVNDFHFGEHPGKDFAAFDRFTLDIIELSPKNKIYLFDTVLVNHPFFKYEKYDYLDNVQMMFGKKGGIAANIKDNPEKFNLILEIGKYIETLAKNFFKSDYKINRLDIKNGDFQYNDFTLNEKFTVSTNPITINADSIDKSHKRVFLNFKSGIKPYGNVDLDLSINPQDSSDFDLVYKFQKLPITLINPYLIAHTSFCLDRGSLELSGKWHVLNGTINANNHLLILDPRIDGRVRTSNSKWLPLKFFMFFAREGSNIIDYQIPITGNLKNPKFHFRDAIFDALENLFVKPVTSVYRNELKNNENEIEESLILKWPMHQSVLSSSQIHFLEKLASTMKDDPGSRLSVYPMPYSTKEQEHVLLYEAKKKYFYTNRTKHNENSREEDSICIERMSIKDAGFLKYLNQQTEQLRLFTIQDKCAVLLKASFVDEKYRLLLAERKNSFMQVFKENEVTKQVQVAYSKNTIPYNGFSYFKLNYTGKKSSSLIRAYERMKELNNEAPRNEFKKARARNQHY